MWHEIDLRSRKTGMSIRTIHSSQDYDKAMDVLNSWYKKHPELDTDKSLEDYVDGKEGVFADYYQVEEPEKSHGVGWWLIEKEHKDG